MRVTPNPLMLDALDQTSTACLTEEEIVAFAAGRLEASRISAAHLHLDVCEMCQLLLSEAAHSLATATTVPLFEREGAAWNTTFQAGAVVGQRYLIRQFIARGGMGEVYEAFDRDLQERVALKTVTSTACDSPSAVRRLKGEVQLARRVSHPNVCRIYDFGTHVMAGTGAQISFLTMEFVEGETLGARLRMGGALPIPEARRLGRQLLLGLGAAHDAGVLHRDFKSDNVMLKGVNGRPCALISDFGLARAFDDDPRRAASVSHAGLVGTFSYLAPEQLEGKPHSTASDIYSLGMVWFEMLTGALPFEQSPSPALAALERMKKQAPPPSSRNPAVPSDLDAIVAGCLSRSPKHRYRTTTEVLDALDELEQRSRPLLVRGKRWFIGASALSLTLASLGAMQGRARPPQQHRGGATAASVSTVAAAPSITAAMESPPPPVASDPAPSPPPRPQNRAQPPARRAPASAAPVAAAAKQVQPGKARAEPVWENPFAADSALEPSGEVVLNARPRPGNATH